MPGRKLTRPKAKLSKFASLIEAYKANKAVAMLKAANLRKIGNRVGIDGPHSGVFDFSFARSASNSRKSVVTSRVITCDSIAVLKNCLTLYLTL